ncbi:MAG: DUF1738 domain-containing protein [Clostridia bacterium]|nr:DUF1738 domain-containing protein [Clostridia bacterium]
MDLFAEITNRIIAEMENGIIPWRKSWVGGASCAVSHVTGKPYSLMNQMLLGKPGEWLTFKQAQAEGGYVRKGEKSRMVVFWKWFESKETKDDGTIEIKEVPFLRSYNLFHIDQCEGIKPKWDKPIENPVQPDARAEAIVDNYVARSGVKIIRTRSNDAFYRPSTDEIHVPEIGQFTEVAEGYACLYHEITHSSGHPSRLNRIADVAAFGSESYSKEELVAELGSAFLVNTAGLETPSQFRNSAAYIHNWLQPLKADKRLIVSASGQAEKAVKYILGTEDKEVDENA